MGSCANPSLVSALLRLGELLLVTVALSLFLPDKFLGMPLSQEVEGYVREVYTGKPLRYRLNGIWVTLTTVALYIVLVGRSVLSSLHTKASEYEF